MTCPVKDRNPVVVVEAGVDVTLTPDEELVAAGTVQVAPNAETSNKAPSLRAAPLTTHVIY